MKTYPKMNAIIKDLLRHDGADYAVYAAQRIEELEARVRELEDFARFLLDDPEADLSSESLKQIKNEQDKLDKALVPLLGRIEKLERVAEAVRELVERRRSPAYYLAVGAYKCVFCGEVMVFPEEDHAPDCPWLKIKQALAALEGKEVC